MREDDPMKLPEHSVEGSIKETLESIIIAFVLAFVFRAFVVEAFVIPTGSMAPTLLGQHIRHVCPACGYRFEVGPDSGQQRVVDGQQVPYAVQTNLTITCPMCDYASGPENRRLDTGDRILVLKYLYAFTEPQRWQVVVFKNPEEPAVNYIKRLIGLPNERIQIVHGDIWFEDRLSDAGWRIARKPPKVQHDVWQPVYHSDYVPLDHAKRNWSSPWRPAGSSRADWAPIESGGLIGRVYRYDPPPADNAVASPGELRFDFNHHADGGVNIYPYNELVGSGGRHHVSADVITDMRLGVTVRQSPPSDDPSDAAALRLFISTHRHIIRAEIDWRSRVRLSTADAEARPMSQWAPQPVEASQSPTQFDLDESFDLDQLQWTTRDEQPLDLDCCDSPRRVELWHADLEATLWIDGRCVARWTDDEATYEQMVGFRPRGIAPLVSVHVIGGAAELRRVNLDRDLYHTQYGQRGTGKRPAELGPDQFFCLGDNSPQSKDGREWSDVDEWVRVLEPGPNGVPAGVVPRDLMIGRAFFVYWPAAYRGVHGSPIIPNFADMRFIH